MNWLLARYNGDEEEEEAFDDKINDRVEEENSGRPSRTKSLDETAGARPIDIRVNAGRSEVQHRTDSMDDEEADGGVGAENEPADSEEQVDPEEIGNESDEP